MKKIGIISILLGLLFVVSCEEQYADYTPPGELSDVSWYMSTEPYAKDPFSISGGGFISFMDLSQGTVSHEWIIEDGNNFLNEQFKKGDTLENFINENVGLSISDTKAHVLFNNNGINKIRLINKFNEPVSYQASTHRLDAYPEGSLWVIDTTFVFNVYGELQPAFKVYQDDIEIVSVTEEDMPTEEDMGSWPTVEVEAGKSLKFVDLTTIDRPNGRQWTIPEGAPSATGGESVDIKFFKLGTNPAGTFKSSRVDPLPSASAEKLIPLMVKVIPSSEPFVFNGLLKEAEDESISFQVSGEVEPFSGEEGSFTVNVKNEVTGFNQNIVVQSARVSDDDSTFIELILVDPIYNSDVITVSYSDGNIKSTDTRDLEDFENKNVSMYFGNSILAGNSWSGYEIAAAQQNKAYAGPGNSFWVGPNGTPEDPNWARGTINVYEGVGSMKFSVDGISKNFQLHQYGLGTIDMVPAGTYKASYMVYLEEGNTMDGFWTWGGQVPGLATELWELTDLPRGQWVKIEHIATLAAITSKKKLSLVINPPTNPNSSSGRQTMYLDNFSLIEVEMRP